MGISQFDCLGCKGLNYDIFKELDFLLGEIILYTFSLVVIEDKFSLDGLLNKIGNEFSKVIISTTINIHFSSFSIFTNFRRLLLLSKNRGNK